MLQDPLNFTTSNGTYLTIIPNGQQYETLASQLINSQKTIVNKKPSSHSNKRKKGVVSDGSGGGIGNAIATKPPRIQNPHCTTGNPNCYCHSGRGRAIYRVDVQGQILDEYCSQAVAAQKLGMTPFAINKALNTQGGGASNASAVKGHIFRYKVEGEHYKRTAKVCKGPFQNLKRKLYFPSFSFLFFLIMLT